MTQQDYNNKIRELAKEQASTSSIKALPTSKFLYQTFENMFSSSMRGHTYSSLGLVLLSIPRQMRYIEGCLKSSYLTLSHGKN